jgi:DNA-binding PadR family transcriptional regulator
MVKTNYTKYIILGFLNYRPLSGYVIRKFVERSIAYFWQLGNGQIYPTLNSMVKSGLVTMHKESSGLGPDSKVYSLTVKGREELDGWLKVPEHDESFRSPMLLKLFFGGDTTRDILIGNLKKYLEETREKQAVMEIFEKNYKQIMEENPEHVYMYLTVLRGKMWYAGNIKWAEQAIRMLKKQGT